MNWTSKVVLQKELYNFTKLNLHGMRDFNQLLEQTEKCLRSVHNPGQKSESIGHSGRTHV